MGIFPRRNAATTIRIFRPMARYLSEQLGREVKLVTTKDFPSFWKGVTHKKYDIVHYNQYHYIKSHQKNGYEVILKNEEFGKSSIAGSLIVRKDTGIKTIQDLKGKKILFGGDKTAMVSYIVPTMLLRRAGLKQNDYQEMFAKNPPNACIGTFHKHADASGTGDIVLNLSVVKNNIDVSQLTFLAVSEKLPHLPWAVKSNMEPDLRNKIRDTLVSLKDNKQGRQILKQARLTGLHVAVDAEYNPHRKIIAEINDK
jgi:phosphonate transport system substrate-binding protein